MKKLFPKSIRGGLLVIPIMALWLTSCSEEAQPIENSALKTEALKDFQMAFERVNAPQNLEKRSGESDIQANQRRVSILADEAKKVLLANGRTEQEIQQMEPGRIVSTALHIYINQQNK